MSVPEISEDNLAVSAPRVRWQVVQRYEALWKLCEAMIAAAEDGERPPDPRWAEIGVRVLKELSSLYRLARPPAGLADEDVVLHGMDPKDVVLASLVALELKAQGL